MALFRWVIIGSFIWLVHWLSPDVAASTSCSASVSPSSVKANDLTMATFSFTNTGSEAINYIKVSVPSNNFSVANYGVVGWSVNAYITGFELYDSVLQPGSSSSITMGVNTGPTEAAAANWKVEGGLSLVKCEGLLGMAITGIADHNAPLMSDPVVSGVSATKAVVSFSANELIKGELRYGTGYKEYEVVLESQVLALEHSFSLEGLQPNTTYYYEYRGIDSSGNESNWNDFYSFTTAAQGETQTSQEVITVVESVWQTVTQRVQLPPMVIMVRDTLAPTVRFTVPNEIVGEPEEITGEARDDKGILRVEYSLDNGGNWLVVDEISGVGTRLARFAFTPPPLMDGTYQVRVRAVDTSNNVKTSEAQVLTIDRLPPKVGGLLLVYETMPLEVNRLGRYELKAGVGYMLFVSSVGGTTELVVAKRGMGEGQAESSLIMRQRERGGIWEGEVRFNQGGEYELWAQGKDGAGQEVTSLLGRVVVAEAGRVTFKGKAVAGAVITAYRMEALTGRYGVHDSQIYGGANPVIAGETGEWRLFLPPGEYYLTSEAEGLRKLVSERFGVDSPEVVSFDIAMSEVVRWHVGPLQVTFNRWLAGVVGVPRFGERTEEVGDKPVGEELPYFEVESSDGTEYSTAWKGQGSLIVLAAPWHPGFSGLMETLAGWEKERGVRVRVILNHTTKERALVMAQKGKYGVSVWADEEGKVAEVLEPEGFPWLVRVDGAGRILGVGGDIKAWTD